MYKYFSSKRYVNLGSIAYRQWKADSHCNLLHGYSPSFYFEFGTNELDTRNWAIDFGGLRPLKGWLEEWFDHTLLVAIDDPFKETLINLDAIGLAKVVEVERTGCEGLADWLYRWVNDPKHGFLKQLAGDRDIWCTRIEVSETQSNMAGVQGTPATWHLFDN